MFLTAQFDTNNAFLVGDVKQPTSTNPNFEIKAAIREYGQLTFEIPPAMINAINPAHTLADGELGYPLSDFMGTFRIKGNFTRARKSPTAAPSVIYVPSVIEPIQ